MDSRLGEHSLRPAQAQVRISTQALLISRSPEIASFSFLSFLLQNPIERIQTGRSINYLTEPRVVVDQSAFIWVRRT